jgi:hypothetical protein
MVAGVLVCSIVASLAGLAVSAVFAGTVPFMVASYMLWGMTGALGFICASLPALERSN